MGEARKRRLTLIKGGKAAEAKGMFVAPERLTNITIQMPSHKAKVAQQVYETMVDKKNCPTPGVFFLAVFEAGLIEFEKFYLEHNAPKPPDRPDIEVPQPPVQP